MIADLDHTAMRTRGGTHKRGINRSLATAGPGAFVAVLARKLKASGHALVRVPAAWTSRQCLVCGSRNTDLTHTRVHCRDCGTNHDRDHAAAANILLRGMAAHASIRNPSGPSGSAETTRLARRLPASECRNAHRASLARDPAGTGFERLRHAALPRRAQERWGLPPPERRCDSYCAPQHAKAGRIREDSRQPMTAAARL